MVATGKPIIAINYYFSPDELGNRIFASENRSDKALFMQTFRDYMHGKGVEVVTIDMADFRDPAVTHVLYFDYSWRSARMDTFLAAVPYEKRALVMIEPSLVNPSLYFTAHYRKRFHTIFTWDMDLLKRNPSYVRINVPVGAEPMSYVDNPFKHLAFHDKRHLVAVSTNRWSYMPHSTYPMRLRTYRYFERVIPGQFDLYGVGWHEPQMLFGIKMGVQKFASYRGPIPGGPDAKVKVIAGYKFALCFENNATEAGYISEKITDCFCARCVPVYYGWKGAADYIPQDAWIDMRQFRSLTALEAYLDGMDEAHHAQYIHAIDRFMLSEQVKFFSMRNLYKVIATRLDAPALKGM